MKRSLLGLLAALVLGASAVIANPAPAPAGALGVNLAQVQPADHDGKDKCGGEAKDRCEAKCGSEAKDRCEEKCGGEAKDRCEAKDKDGDDKEKEKGCSGDDDKDRCRHDDGDKDRDREGDGRRCVGLIVICIG